MWNDYRGRAVLIAGGTCGIGRAAGLAFGKRGASVTLTYKWGSAELDELREAYAEAGAPEPSFVEADATRAEEQREVLEQIRARHDALDALVSNVALAGLVRSVDDYDERLLLRSVSHTAWPLVSWAKSAATVFGRYPRYVVGVSSEGVDSHHVNYDFAAAAKAVLETLCRYASYRLHEEGVRVNVVRTRFVDTASLRATFGDEFPAFVERYSPGAFSPPEDVGEAIFGVCSGLMDGLTGQVITVDGGANVFENFSRLYTERGRTGLGRPGGAPREGEGT